MQSIYDIELSLRTVMLSFALPFIYFGYHAKYWYLPDRVKLFDFIVSALSVLVFVFIALRILHLARSPAVHGDTYQLELLILHFGAPMLALFQVFKGRRSIGRVQAAVQVTQPASPEDYTPETLNDQVQKIGWDEMIISTELKKELNSVISLLKDPQTARNYGIDVPKGILLNGPPGTGKTTIAKVIANTAGLSFFALKSDEIVSKWVGESEKNLTKLFEAASRNAPAVIFIDEIDSLGKKRSDKNASHSDNLLNHLLQLMDGVVKVEGLYVIAATNRADLVDDALKRAGRLNRVIEIPLPDLEARRKLFELYLSKLRYSDDIDIDILAKVTEGNSAADLKEICNQAGLYAFQRESEEGGRARDYTVTSADIETALEKFTIDEDEADALFDESKSGGAPAPLNSQIETLTWDDVIVNESVKQELNSVVKLLKDPETARKYGITVPKGILLNGPPGTGKTTIAKVMANIANLSFFVLQMDEIVSKWVGESEKNLTRFFRAASKHAPSVIFIDEVDSIGKNRSEGNAQHADNLLNHLLQMIDGVIKRDGLYIIAATNRADLVDPALKRGGRLNKVIEIPLPDADARKALFSMYLSKLKVVDEIDMDVLADITGGKSAADIKEICNQAGLNAFKRDSESGSPEYSVKAEDIEEALGDFTG